MDNVNQSIIFVGVVNDSVQCYAFEQIEPLLKHIYGKLGPSKNLKAIKPAGVTDEQIDQLLNQYL